MKIVLFLTLFIVAASAQQCVSPNTNDPNICLFTKASSFTNDLLLSTAEKCSTANTNPWNTYPPTNSAPSKQAACNAAINADGSSCINAYVKYQCSAQCELCGTHACSAVANAVLSNCQTAKDQGCFDIIFTGGGSSGCTSWNIDSSKIPSFSGTTTKATTTTTTTKATTTTTGTGTSTTSSASSTIVGVPLLFVAAVFFFMALSNAPADRAY